MFGNYRPPQPRRKVEPTPCVADGLKPAMAFHDDLYTYCDTWPEVDGKMRQLRFLRCFHEDKQNDAQADFHAGRRYIRIGYGLVSEYEIIA